MRAATAHVLALMVVLAQPVASLVWLDGVHATLEQAALHEAAARDGKTDSRLSQVTAGPEFAPAVPHAESFQNLLHGALTVAPKAPMPDGPPRYAPLAGVVPSQHSPPVPHRPPILLLPTFAFS